MRIFKAFVLVLAACASLGAARPKSAPVAYTLSPELNGADLVALDVTMRLRAGPDGTLRLQLPDSSAGVKELWRYIRDLRVEGARSVAEDGPGARLVRAAPGAPLTVRYRVVSAFDHDPGAADLETYKPTVRPRWFWAYGEALFVRPARDEAKATFEWTGGAYPFASDLQHPAGRPMSMDDLLESVAVGGPDLQIFQRDLGGAPLRVAVVGRYDFPAQVFADTVTRIISGERAFWGGHEGPFLVAIAPLTPLAGSKSARGEGRGDAFAILTSSDMPLEFLKGLVAHEYFHTWNPARLGGSYEGEREPAAYWFSEGFTDFYARRLALRMGVFSLEDFVDAWNTMLREYAASPVVNAPGALILTDFWKTNQVHQLPYWRGAILAATWDRELRRRSGGRVGLDQVMRAMRAQAAKRGARAPKAPDLFVAVARRYGLDVRDDLARVMDRGETAQLPPDAFGPCLRIHNVRLPSYDSGFEVSDADNKRTITGVKPGSPAYAAGLRDGMLFVRREAGVRGDSRVAYRLRVLDGGAERVISFQPVGQGMETLQEIVLPNKLTPQQRQACVVQAAGTDGAR